MKVPGSLQKVPDIFEQARMVLDRVSRVLEENPGDVSRVLEKIKRAL